MTVIDLKYVESIIKKNARKAGECYDIEKAKDLRDALIFIECDLISLLHYLEKGMRFEE